MIKIDGPDQAGILNEAIDITQYVQDPNEYSSARAVKDMLSEVSDRRDINAQLRIELTPRQIMDVLINLGNLMKSLKPGTSIDTRIAFAVVYLGVSAEDDPEHRIQDIHRRYIERCFDESERQILSDIALRIERGYI